MRALCWHGKEKVSIDTVPDPKIEHPGDVILRITATAICGSDLHLYNALVPTMDDGDVLGHEFMGEVVEKGSAVKDLQVGDRVVNPFTISCGSCFFCKRELYSCCDTTNTDPKRELAIKLMGHQTAGMYGYGHMTGGYRGGQAEYARVPHADVGPIKIPDGLPDDKVLFLSDIFPTGWMAAENANIQPGDTVAVWGAGPVGLFTLRSAWMQGAGRVISIEAVPERAELARSFGRAEVIESFDPTEVYDTLQQMTGGRGPDSCIDAVGTEAHGHGIIDNVIDHTKDLAHLPMPRPHVLQQIAKCCRKGGSLSIPGVYMGFVNMFPIGTIINKALTLKTGQTHMQKYLQPLLDHVVRGDIDLSEIISHRIPLSEAPGAYKMFQEKKDGCVKVFMTP